MKKWLAVPAVCLLTLAACGGDDTTESNNPADSTDDEAGMEDNASNEETNESTDMSEDDNENEAEESVEEEAAEIVYEINPNLWTVQPIEGSGADDEVVLLTIDDAPDKYGVDMAATLKEVDAPAIFFVNGHFINTEEKEEQLLEIYEMGFEIGNHTMGHPNLSEISEEQQRAEIVDLNDKIEEITGERPRFFRAPFGVNTDYVREVVAEEEMTLMNWTYGYDWDSNYMTKEAIADIMVNAPELGKGGNLLMHDREHTSAALEDIVNGLRDKGYDFVDPDQLK
ncbi:peptidoglycan/xylan/chitin deacetylase (PgdA/CDA1 family) [Alkalihalobacillus xiaoxiensis]|uniref:Peptidoglycan/xylan/chitin deacetylase (PgdA/CDA1 family) n=1 Tax=Shouchella xiaoxiensis TaxID=766895 RepID=A0ABS2SPQ5_9BACI|nr:polysaccharide deacetylase family protein [Shouchella xiaoxiensis]MBM7837503.1 peptidoglycan/xylan/chitin deacetylase (PgdA/CDA1 family) [Shouchella xiaoxiensis]